MPTVPQFMAKLTRLVRCLSKPNQRKIGWFGLDCLKNRAVLHFNSFMQLPLILYGQDICNRVDIRFSFVQLQSMMLLFTQQKWSSWSWFMGRARQGWSGAQLGLPHKIPPILPHPNDFHFPDFPIPHGGLLHNDIPATAEAGPGLSRTYHIFKQFQSHLN